MFQVPVASVPSVLGAPIVLYDTVAADEPSNTKPLAEPVPLLLLFFYMVDQYIS